MYPSPYAVPDENKGYLCLMAGFIVAITALFAGMLAIADNERNVLKQKLVALNDWAPTVVVKQIIVNDLKKHTCAVEDSAGKRYIIDIDEEHIPVIGEKWKVEFYNKDISERNERNLIPRLISKVE